MKTVTNEYRIHDNGLKEEANCQLCKFSKKIGDGVYNCYYGGNLVMSKKDTSKPARMCNMSWCHKFEWKE
jgi:hypothetical protein